MAINFTPNPSVGQTHTVGTSVWRWNGYAWVRIPDPGAKGQKGEVGEKGIQGVVGDKGNKGNKGEKGAIDEKGNKGEQGNKGDDGPTGPVGGPGPTGPTGDKGDIGPTGNKGQKGEVGEKGQKGAKGIKGDEGAKGEKGQKGDKGDKGQKGEVGVGVKGDKGNKGDTGDKGSTGDKGNQGDKGIKGNEGPTGPASTKGNKGNKGDKGTKGDEGPEGPTGPVATKGNKGQKGQKGQTGLQGIAGADGDGGGLFPIEAERSSSVTTNQYYAIGNGATTSQGMRIPIACSLQYMTLRASSNVTITVELYVNGSASGKTVSLSSSTSATADFTSAPLSINADDYIAFRSLNNASATTVVAGWFGHDGIKGQKGDKGQKGQGDKGTKGVKGDSITGPTGMINAPYGAVAAYSNSNQDTISYDDTELAMRLQTTGSDTQIGAAFPAFRVNLASNESHKLSIKYKASAATSSGFYVRVYEYDAALPTGKLAVSNSATNSLVQEDTRRVGNWKENAAITTDWQTTDFTYTPTSTAVWTSIVVLNWSGMSTNALFIRDPFHQLVASSGGTGAPGPTGPTGPTGSGGPAGPPGPPGSSGGTGPAGPPGPPGSSGGTGPAGPPGPTGGGGQKGQKGQSGSGGGTGPAGPPGPPGGGGQKGQKGQTGSGGGPGGPGPTGPPGPNVKTSSNRLTSDFQTSSTSYQTALSVSINPTATNSSILVVVTGSATGRYSGNSSGQQATAYVTTYKNGSPWLGIDMFVNKGNPLFRTPISHSVMDNANHGGNTVSYTHLTLPTSRAV